MRAVALLRARVDTWLAGGSDSPGRGVRGLLRRALASDFVQKVVEIFVTRIVLVAIGFGTGVLIARILGPEGRGWFAVAGAISGIGVQLGNLGLHTANTYTVARDRSRLPELVGNSLLVSFVMGALAALAAGSVLAWRPDLSPLPAALLALVLVAIPINLAGLLSQNLLLGLQEVRTFNKVELRSRLLTVVLIGVVIALGRVSPASVMAAGLVAAAVNLSWAVGRLRPMMERPPRVSLALLRDNLGYGLRAYLACLFGFLVIRLDLLMIRYMQGAEPAGFYSIAVTVADMLYMLPVAIGTILFPKLAALDTLREKRTLVRRTAGTVALMMVGIALAAILAGHPVIGLVFGAEYLPAVPPFMVLAAAMVFLSVATIYSNYLAAVGYPWFVVVAWGALSVVNVALNLMLIPRFGIVGAAWSSLICYGGALLALGAYAARYRPPAAAA